MILIWSIHMLTCHGDPSSDFGHRVLHVMKRKQRPLVSVQLDGRWHHHRRNVERFVQHMRPIVGGVLVVQRTPSHRGYRLLYVVQPQNFRMVDAVSMVVNTVRIFKYFLLMT